MNDRIPEPTIFLIDDDPSVLRANARLLRLEGWVIKEFNSAEEFLKVAAPELLGCAILDYAMPNMTGLELQQELRDRGCRLPVIFLTAHANWPLAVSAMKQGAIDFLAKPCPPDVLLACVRSAVNRQLQTHQAYLATLKFRDRLESLTPRECQVMELVANGMLNKQIAARLGTVEKTVKVHRGQVMRKLQLDSVAELVQFMGNLRQLDSEHS